MAFVLRLLAMASETERSRMKILWFRSQICEMLFALGKIMSHMWEPNSTVHSCLVHGHDHGHLFQVQVKAIDIMSSIEHQIMKSSTAQFFNSELLKGVEDSIDELCKEVISI